MRALAVQGPCTRGEQGAALIIVLWLVVLLTLLATTISAVSVSHRRAAASYATAVENQEAMDSAIRISLLEIIGASEHQRVPVVSSTSLSLLDKSLSIVIEKESGRIDLNAASEDLLFAAFAANGWQESDAKQMAARIIDWRSNNELTSSGASTAFDNSPQSYSPRHGPFETVDEIRQVIGGEKISPSLLQAFTVYTHGELPSIDSAAAPVVSALQWAESQQLSGRHWLDSPMEESSPVLVSTNAIHTVEIGEILRIRACVAKPVESGCRIAVVRLTGDERKPLQIFLWQFIPNT